MTQIVAPYLQTCVNKTKLLELALVHDLEEAQCGDVPLCQQSRNTQYKQQNESDYAISRYVAKDIRQQDM